MKAIARDERRMTNVMPLCLGDKRIESFAFLLLLSNRRIDSTLRAGLYVQARFRLTQSIILVTLSPPRRAPLLPNPLAV